MSKTAYIALGSNIGNGKKNIENALNIIQSLPNVTVEKISDIVETKPWGYLNQNNFFNACARLSVNVSPEVLLGMCLGIESAMGRIRIVKNGPRTIDIDLIMYEDEKRNTQELILPHPGMNERDFVLIPLKQVVKEEEIPNIEKAISELKERYIL